ncbi:MAG: hypothetical protein FJW20_17130 [Acidimicrobiia bacterium]|nr:hypothetical protein [Acidimicrobiia bacterium]
MQQKAIILTALLACGAFPVLAQDAEPAYVRRFSAGPMLSVLGLSPIPGNDQTVTLTDPPFNAVHRTTSKPKRVGYGFVAQLVLTDRFALNTNFLLRRMQYELRSDIHEGIDNPRTIVDERRFSQRVEETRARVLDIPITLRFYGKNRFDYGPRWFVDAGGAIRNIRSIGSQISRGEGGDPPAVVSNSPITPSKKTIRGVVGGFGVQAIDELGIRIIPQIRYTRWFGANFSTLSTVSQRNQIEAILAVTF